MNIDSQLELDPIRSLRRLKSGTKLIQAHETKAVGMEDRAVGKIFMIAGGLVSFGLLLFLFVVATAVKCPPCIVVFLLVTPAGTICAVGLVLFLIGAVMYWGGPGSRSKASGAGLDDDLLTFEEAVARRRSDKSQSVLPPLFMDSFRK